MLQEIILLVDMRKHVHNSSHRLVAGGVEVQDEGYKSPSLLRQQSWKLGCLSLAPIPNASEDYMHCHVREYLCLWGFPERPRLEHG